MRLACTVIQVFLVIWYLAFQLTAIFQCFPIQNYWLHGPGGYCIHFIPFYTALAATNVVTDIIILILPMPQIYKVGSYGTSDLYERATKVISVANTMAKESWASSGVHARCFVSLLLHDDLSRGSLG